MGIVSRVKTRLISTLLKRWVSVPDPRNHPQVTVGRHTYGLGPFQITTNVPRDTVCIGNFCSFARGSRILASGEHYTDRVSTFPFTSHIIGKGPKRDMILPRKKGHPQAASLVESCSNVAGVT